MRTHFAATLDQLAWYAGYVSRKTEAQTDTRSRNQQLGSAYVNETHLQDSYTGAIDWDILDPSVIKASLANMGFTLTTARRTIPAIVVEPSSQGHEWAYLNEEGELENAGPNDAIDQDR